MPSSLVPNAYGLLYVSEHKERFVNLRAEAGDPLDIYLRNAITLAQSARAVGMPFELVTNDPERLADLARTMPGSDALVLRPHAFTLDVPPGIRFQSSHFRLELIQAFGTGAFGEHVAMVDIDAVFMHKLVLPDPDTLYVFDITRHYFGEQLNAQAADDLSRLAGTPLAAPRWFGGEFKAGPATMFATLGRHIAAAWPDYRAVAQDVFHTGEETLLSAALNRMMVDGDAVRDAGALGLVSRWWSRRTPNSHGPLSTARQSALLHLPGCKEFLARDIHPFDHARFMANHGAWCRARLDGERKRVADDRARGRMTHVPQLT